MENILKIKKTIYNFFEKTNFYRYFDNDDSYTIYIAGSIMEGFGNEKSDVDIFVLYKSTDLKEKTQRYFEVNKGFNIFNKNNKVIITSAFENTDLDIEFYEIDYVKEFITQLDNSVANYNDERYDLFHRLKYGVPLINEKNFNSLQKSVNFEKFNKLPAQMTKDYYAVKTKDIQGAYQEEMYDTSYYMAMDLLENCVNVFLAIHGETNPNRKWMFKKINRYNKQYANKLDLIGCMYSAYKNVNLLEKNSMKHKTLDVMKTCQKINILIEKELINENN